MCGSGASRHTTSGGLSLSSKVASLSSSDWGVVLAPYFTRANIPKNPGTLGLGTVAVTPAIVSQLRYTDARVGASWKFGVLRACAGAVEKAGDGAGSNVGTPYMVPVVTDW